MTVNKIWIKKWRKRLGLNQKQAAALLGLKARMIQNYEAGSHQIPRYVRLSCFALMEGIVEFDEKGSDYTHDLVSKAEDLIKEKKRKNS